MRYVFLAFAAIASMNLGACTLVQEVERELFDTRTTNLTESSYAATDMLATQTRDTISAANPVRVAVLTDTAAPGETTPFGQQVANNIASRLVQLGYNVRSYPMTDSTYQSASMIPPVTASTAVSGGAPRPTQSGITPGSPRGMIVIGGTYTKTKDSILMSLRAVQESDHRVLGAYDYTMPLTHDLRELSMTKAEQEKQTRPFFVSEPAPAAAEMPAPGQQGATASPQPLTQTP